MGVLANVDLSLHAHSGVLGTTRAIQCSVIIPANGFAAVIKSRNPDWKPCYKSVKAQTIQPPMYTGATAVKVGEEGLEEGLIVADV
jgi:hypothetical protein